MSVELHQTARTLIRNNLFTRLQTNTQINVYKGTIPTNVASFDPATHTSNLLITYTTTDIGSRFENNSTFETLQLSPPNAVATASATGTATWYAIFSTDADNLAILGDVTDEFGDGSLQLDSTSIVSGNSITIHGFNIHIT